MTSIILVNLLLTILVVWIHNEYLRGMSAWLSRYLNRHRSHLMIAVFGALIAHVIEIWIYGIGIYWIAVATDLGSLQGIDQVDLLDCVYFSLSNFTSLGMGDIQPVGGLRFVAGFEALTGLVLITWTASFLFLEMQKSWSNGK